MLQREKLFPWAAPVFVLILLVFTMLSTGCSFTSPKASSPDIPLLTANEHERVEGSLDFDVVDFNWTYINDGAHLLINGKVANNSDKAQQALTIYAEVYDENGASVGSVSSYLTPTYLPVGSQGSFEFTLMPRRTEGIKFLKIVTNTRPLQ